MRYVLCLLDPMDRGLTEELRRQYEALPQKRGLEYAWRSFDHAAVLTAWDDPWGDPLAVQDGEWVAAGVVRLDNREEVERWVESDRTVLARLTDLALVLKVVAETGMRRIRDILGDFAFAAWHGATRRAIAATDTLGVRKLFYTERHGRVAFATRAESLVLEERYEVQYLAEYLALCPVTPGLSAFEGVRRLPAGVAASLEQGTLRSRRYWSAEEVDGLSFTPTLEREAPEQLRELLSESIKKRVTGSSETWAQLSGGLDSSSIVSVAQWLNDRGEMEHALAGTVTFVDWENTDADEREYVDASVDRWAVRNEVIVDPPLWLDGEPPPHLDQPRDSLAFNPRERRLCEIVRGSGGRVLLAGFGSDELFTGTTTYFADRVVRGRLWSAGRDIAHWAALGRTSFWELAWGNALAPLIPRRLRPASSINQGRLPPWISNEAARRFALRNRTFSVSGSHVRLGRQYRQDMLTNLQAVMTDLDAGGIGDRLEVRYPFLCRKLVEFALCLPPEMCTRPHARKWVLRCAMQGLLPEAVRCRVGKGGATDLVVRSLATRASVLRPLLAQPILSQLGVVNADALCAAYTTALMESNGPRNVALSLQQTLTLEAWLQIRAGRWPPGPSQ